MSATKITKPRIRKAPVHLNVPMPPYVIAAAKRLHESGVPIDHASIAFGVKRQTHIRLIKDKGNNVYQPKVVGAVLAKFKVETIELLLMTHLTKLESCAAYDELLKSLEDMSSMVGNNSNT